MFRGNADNALHCKSILNIGFKLQRNFFLSLLVCLQSPSHGSYHGPSRQQRAEGCCWVMCLIHSVDEWPTGNWDVTEPGALHAEAHACTWLLQLGLCSAFANPEGQEGSISAALMYCFCQKLEAVIFLARLFDFLISLTVENFDVFFVSVSALSVSVRLIRGSPSLQIALSSAPAFPLSKSFWFWSFLWWNYMTLSHQRGFFLLILGGTTCSFLLFVRSCFNILR